MKKLALAIALCLTFVASSAVAKKKGGVTMPDSKTIAGKKVVLNGMGIREATVFNVDVYVAGLYLEKKSRAYKAIINSDQVKQVHLKFVRDVDRGDITKAWRESFRKNSGKNYKDIKAHVKKLNSWMSKIKEGNTLTFTVVPGKGTTVNVNGRD
ncbi:MAG: chalcone isomerase family protein, partial [Deltaproteobacteria bacterium]|nr:chalcone isomerase family protein [Deltaproteobacteria bacterium]